MTTGGRESIGFDTRLLSTRGVKEARYAGESLCCGLLIVSTGRRLVNTSVW